MIDHTPVMLTEVLHYLNVLPNEWYIDATLGTGGHTQAILDLGAQVLGIDRDEQALIRVKQKITSSHLKLVRGNFSNLSDVANGLGINHVAGILFDLGTSALQLEDSQRGFSFQVTAPLDMRMDQSLSVTAADLVNALSEKELALLFTKYSQEGEARPLARAIVGDRKIKPFTTTGQLAQICIQVKGGRHSHLHPATKVFQALRMAVNDELNNLAAALPQAVNKLKPEGRLVVISFHEGEDRLVKQFINQGAAEHLESLTKKPVVPGPTEISQNPRSRSAKLRAVKKLYVP